MDAKKVIALVMIVFLGFWMFNDPRGLADAAGTTAETAWGMASQLFRAVIRFVGAL